MFQIFQLDHAPMKRVVKSQMLDVGDVQYEYGVTNDALAMLWIWDVAVIELVICTRGIKTGAKWSLHIHVASLAHTNGIFEVIMW